MMIKPTVTIGEPRRRTDDILVMEISSGRTVIDNMHKYFSLFYASNTLPGTREYIAQQHVKHSDEG